MRVNSMRKGRLGKENRDRNVGISCAQINVAVNMHNGRRTMGRENGVGKALYKLNFETNKHKRTNHGLKPTIVQTQRERAKGWGKH